MPSEKVGAGLALDVHNGFVVVKKIHPNAARAASAVGTGDILLHVEGIDASSVMAEKDGMDKISRAMMGAEGTDLHLTILKAGTSSIRQISIPRIRLGLSESGNNLQHSNLPSTSSSKSPGINEKLQQQATSVRRAVIPRQPVEHSSSPARSSYKMSNEEGPPRNFGSEPHPVSHQRDLFRSNNSSESPAMQRPSGPVVAPPTVQRHFISQVFEQGGLVNSIVSTNIRGQPSPGVRTITNEQQFAISPSGNESGPEVIKQTRIISTAHPRTAKNDTGLSQAHFASRPETIQETDNDGSSCQSDSWSSTSEDNEVTDHPIAPQENLASLANTLNSKTEHIQRSNAMPATHSSPSSLHSTNSAKGQGSPRGVKSKSAESESNSQLQSLMKQMQEMQQRQRAQEDKLEEERKLRQEAEERAATLAQADRERELNYVATIDKLTRQVAQAQYERRQVYLQAYGRHPGIASLPSESTKSSTPHSVSIERSHTSATQQNMAAPRVESAELSVEQGKQIKHDDQNQSGGKPQDLGESEKELGHQSVTASRKYHSKDAPQTLRTEDGTRRSGRGSYSGMPMQVQNYLSQIGANSEAVHRTFIENNVDATALGLLCMEDMIELGLNEGQAKHLYELLHGNASNQQISKAEATVSSQNRNQSQPVTSGIISLNSGTSAPPQMPGANNQVPLVQQSQLFEATADQKPVGNAEVKAVALNAHSKEQIANQNRAAVPIDPSASTLTHEKNCSDHPYLLPAKDESATTDGNSGINIDSRQANILNQESRNGIHSSSGVSVASSVNDAHLIAQASAWMKAAGFSHLEPMFKKSGLLNFDILQDLEASDLSAIGIPVQDIPNFLQAVRVLFEMQAQARGNPSGITASISAAKERSIRRSRTRGEGVIKGVLFGNVMIGKGSPKAMKEKFVVSRSGVIWVFSDRVAWETNMKSSQVFVIDGMWVVESSSSKRPIIGIKKDLMSMDIQKDDIFMTPPVPKKLTLWCTKLRAGTLWYKFADQGAAEQRKIVPSADSLFAPSSTAVSRANTIAAASRKLESQRPSGNQTQATPKASVATNHLETNSKQPHEISQGHLLSRNSGQHLLAMREETLEHPPRQVSSGSSQAKNEQAQAQESILMDRKGMSSISPKSRDLQPQDLKVIENQNYKDDLDTQQLAQAPSAVSRDSSQFAESVVTEEAAMYDSQPGSQHSLSNWLGEAAAAAGSTRQNQHWQDEHFSADEPVDLGNDDGMLEPSRQTPPAEDELTVSISKLEFKNSGKHFNSPCLSIWMQSISGQLEIVHQVQLFGPQSKAHTVFTLQNSSCKVPSNSNAFVVMLFSCIEGIRKRRVDKYWAFAQASSLPLGNSQLQLFKCPVDLQNTTGAVPKKFAMVQVNVSGQLEP